MADTALDIISRSLRLLNVLGRGQVASGQMANDALKDLNSMLSAWRLKRLTIRTVVRRTFTLSNGVATYTFGPGATMSITPLPTWIDAAAIIASGSTHEHPIDVLSDQRYQTIRNKSLTSSLPLDGVYLDKTYSTSTGRSNIVVLPTPSAAGLTLVLYVPLPLVLFEDLSATSYTLPDGYEMAIRYNLAKDLSNTYPGTWDQKKEDAAVQSLAAIQRVNETPRELTCDPMLTGGGGDGFDIYRGS